jgi:cytochrome oxidase Cu insertion factor (SCO1/SenC/PrrC family)
VSRRTGRSVVAATAIAMCAALAGCGGGSEPAPSTSFGAQVDFAVPAAIANLPLTKPDGTTTTLGAYKGKTVMIADFLSLCTDICPLISANTAALARSLNADGQQNNVALLEISVDPQRDTPTRLAAYQKLFGAAAPNWTLLTASPATVKAIWKFFGVEYQREKEEKPPSIDWFTHKPLTYDVAHSDDLIFLDATGHERFVVNADPDVQGKLPPPTLVKTLTSEGLKSLYHPNAVGDWTVAQGLSVFSWLLNTKLSEAA